MKKTLQRVNDLSVVVAKERSWVRAPQKSRSSRGKLLDDVSAYSPILHPRSRFPSKPQSPHNT